MAFEIKDSAMLATKELHPGEIIFSEAALVTGPGRFGFPICLGCYNMVDGEYYCDKCGWQVCNEQCESCGVHAAECPTYAEKELTATWEDVTENTLSMDFMGAYRLLLAIQAHPEHRNLLTLDMHNDRRKEWFNIKYFVGCEDIILKTIKDACGLTSFSDDEILTAMGLFELYGADIMNGAKAFHPSTPFMRNSCVPNTYMSVEPDFSVVVRASTNIVAGSLLTRCLGDVLACNLIRRRDLQRNYFLDCDCARCRDGTELGTNYGGLVCSKCANIQVSNNPRDESSMWVCVGCGESRPGEECCQTLSNMKKKCDEGLASTGGSIGTHEFILNTSGEWDVCPSGGQVIVDVKRSLVSMYGTVQGATYDLLDNDKIKIKVEYCNEVINLLNKFYPGNNYIAAMLHYEAANAVYALTMKGDSSLCSVGKWHCEQAASICRTETPGSMYHQLGAYVQGLMGAFSS